MLLTCNKIIEDIDAIGLVKQEREAAVWLVGQIAFNARILHKRHDKFFGIYAKFYQAMLGRGRNCIQKMRDAGILNCDGTYKVGYKCMNYFLPDKYQHEEWVWSEPAEGTQQFIHNKQMKAVLEDLPPELRAVRECLEHFSLSEEGLKEFESLKVSKEGWTPEVVGNMQALVDSIQNKNGYLKADKKTGRVYSPITNLPKTLRKHLLIDGKPTVEIDVKSAQISLLSSFYGDITHSCPEAEWEAEQFEAVVTFGDIYSYLSHGITREQAKKELITAIMGEVKHQFCFEAFRNFAECFPILAELITRSKKRDYKNVAYRLQKAEADIMIGYVSKKLLEDNIPFANVHDSVVIPADEAAQEATMVHMEEGWKRAIGYCPGVSTK